MKPRPTPCFFWNDSLYCDRSASDGRHVGFVERRQDGGVLLGGQQPLGDALADRRHALARLAAAVGGRLSWCRRLACDGGRRAACTTRVAGRSRSERPTGVRRRGSLRQERLHVLLDDAAAAAGAGELARSRRPRRRPVVGRTATAAAPTGGGGRRQPGSALSSTDGPARPPLSAVAAAPTPFLDRGRPPRRRGPSGPPSTAMRRTPVAGGGHFRRGLVGLQFVHRFVGAHGVAVGLQPAREDALGDRLSDRRAL